MTGMEALPEIVTQHLDEVRAPCEDLFGRDVDLVEWDADLKPYFREALEVRSLLPPAP
jgi:hypothetical protein